MDFPVYNPERYSGIDQPQTQAQGDFQGRKYSPNHQNANLPANYQSPPPSLVSVNHKIGSETIKSNSRIQYVPFEKKVIDYVDEKKYRVVPKKKLVNDYRDHVSVEMVPRELTVEDYYAVQYIRCYVPEIIPEKKIQHIPKQRKLVKYQYIPVERQIVHYPQHSLDEEAPRYLGVREDTNPNTRYENVSEEDFRLWEREYGYRRGESIQALNEKIRAKYEREKEMYFKQFQGSNVSTLSTSHYRPALSQSTYRQISPERGIINPNYRQSNNQYRTGTTPPRYR